MMIRHDEKMVVNGRLTQVGLSFFTNGRNRIRSAVFLCSCGVRLIARKSAVSIGHTTSCGCAVQKGESRGAYGSWLAMKERCGNRNNNRYYAYGARGITVCERWMKFKNFLEDMGDRPDGKTIDRINTDGMYCKENCKWSSKEEQARNKRKKR